MTLYILYLFYGLYSFVMHIRRGTKMNARFIGACSVILLMNVLCILLLFFVLTLAQSHLQTTTSLLVAFGYLIDIVAVVLLALFSKRLMARMMHH